MQRWCQPWGFHHYRRVKKLRIRELHPTCCNFPLDERGSKFWHTVRDFKKTMWTSSPGTAESWGLSSWLYWHTWHPERQSIQMSMYSSYLIFQRPFTFKESKQTKSPKPYQPTKTKTKQTPKLKIPQIPNMIHFHVTFLNNLQKWIFSQTNTHATEQQRSQLLLWVEFIGF